MLRAFCAPGGTFVSAPFVLRRRCPSLLAPGSRRHSHPCRPSLSDPTEFSFVLPASWSLGWFGFRGSAGRAPARPGTAGAQYPGAWPGPWCEGRGASPSLRDCQEEVTPAGVACSENGMGRMGACLVAGTGAHVWELQRLCVPGLGEEGKL